MPKKSSGNVRLSSQVAEASANYGPDTRSGIRESSRRPSADFPRIGPVRATHPPNPSGDPISAYRDRVEIGSLLDTRLRMRRSLTLEIERQGDSYVAKCSALNEAGYGDDPSQAVQDIRWTIADIYWKLKEDQDRLGADLVETWRKLSELVYEA